MSNSGETAAAKPDEPKPAVSPARAAENGGVWPIVRRWRREDLLTRGYVTLRGLSLLFSAICFIIVSTNRHGDWKNFDKYEEYRYLLAISFLSTIYSGAQVFRYVYNEFYNGRLSSPPLPRFLVVVDFVGDQIMAYLLMSSMSAAIPITNRMRENGDNIFTDSSASAISMAFFAFFCFAVSALISGFKLSTQPYI